MTRVERQRSLETPAVATGRPSSGKIRETKALGATAASQRQAAFGDCLARSYEILANDADALEAAKAVVQVLPYFEAATTELRSSGGGVMARARGARRAQLDGAPPAATPLTLQIRLDGDAVDVAAWCNDGAALEQVLAAREALEEGLARRGLRLRHFGVAERASAEAEAAKARQLLDDPSLRRSYMEVIA